MPSPIRFYKYYFVGNNKPIIMEAPDRGEADKMLVKLSDMSDGKINLKAVCDVRVETPIVGISTTKMGGKEYVWVGRDKTKNGWLLEEEFEKIKDQDELNNNPKVIF